MHASPHVLNALQIVLIVGMSYPPGNFVLFCKLQNEKQIMLIIVTYIGE